MIDDPDVLRVCNGETLARVDCDGQEPSLSPICRRGPSGILQGHLNNVVQDKLLLIWPVLRRGSGDGDHDVLPPCVFRTIEEGQRGVREILLITLEQQLLGPVPVSRSRLQHMTSRPPRSVPTRGHQEAPFVSFDTGPYRAAGGFAF